LGIKLYLTINSKKVDKVSRLLDVLDKHLKEENCRHNAKEIYDEYTLSIR